MFIRLDGFVHVLCIRYLNQNSRRASVVLPLHKYTPCVSHPSPQVPVNVVRGRLITGITCYSRKVSK